jgi:hypothetical protein
VIHGYNNIAQRTTTSEEPEESSGNASHRARSDLN